METFSQGRDFAAWLGLVPRQHSSGGKDGLAKQPEWVNARFGGSW